MPTFDLHCVRSQFPALDLEVNGQPAVFLDGPGGTQVPQRVIEAIKNYLVNANANTHGAFLTAQRTEQMLADAHAAVADLLGCDAREVAFGPNMTTLAFALSRSIGRDLQPGDEIIVTQLDHDANVAPWWALEERGAVIRTVDFHLENCTLNLDHLQSLLNERTKLVAVGYASNAVGTINDVAAITKAAHEAGALSFVDAVHYAPHGPIDVRAIDCDFLACSAYKFFGPHVGVLYGKAEHLERLRPYKVRPAPNEIPDCWETGTQNHEGLAGVVAAIDYLEELGRRHSPDPLPKGKAGRRQALVNALSAVSQYERDLAGQLIPRLLAIPGVEFHGIRDPARFDRRTPTVSIRLEGVHPQDLAAQLGEQGLFVWDGNYYALNVTERLGVEESGGMVRIGLVHYNTSGEIDRLLAALTGVSRKGVSRKDAKSR